jgi:hypothetical protein
MGAAQMLTPLVLGFRIDILPIKSWLEILQKAWTALCSNPQAGSETAGNPYCGLSAELV